MTKFFMVLFFLIATIGCTLRSQEEPLRGKVIVKKADPALQCAILLAEDGTFVEVDYAQFIKAEVGDMYYSRRWKEIIDE